MIVTIVHKDNSTATYANVVRQKYNKKTNEITLELPEWTALLPDIVSYVIFLGNGVEIASGLNLDKEFDNEN